MDIAAVYVTQQPNSNITWPTDVCFQGLQAGFQVAPSDKAFVRGCVRAGGRVGRTNLCRGVRPPRRHILQVVSPRYVTLVCPLCSEGPRAADAFSPLPPMSACAPRKHD